MSGVRPAISIIIPSRNRRDLLTITLENIFNQTYTNYEVIVVDDSSTDGTFESLMSAYKHKVTVLKNKGTGPGAARNTGMEVARGEFIKFFDSDDLMTVNTLHEQYLALQNSEKKFVYSPYFRAVNKGIDWVTEDAVIMHYHPFHNRLPLWYFMLVESLFIAIPGMLFRREVLEQAGPWNESTTAYEDWDYLFRISLLEPYPVHTNTCAFLYRIHGTQTTVSNFSDEQRDLDKIKVLDAINRLICNDNRFGFWTKYLFRNKFYQLYTDTKSMRIRAELERYNSVIHRFLWQYLRLRFRIGRNKTKTVWQPSHGPQVSEETIHYYLRQI